MFKWSGMKDKNLLHLKISPIATTPHESRPFRMTHELSHNVIIDGVPSPLENETTVKIAHEEALQHT